LYVAPQQLGSFERLTAGEDDNNMTAPSRERRRIWLYDFVSTSKSLTDEKPSIQSSTVPYHEAWDLQKQLVDHQLARLGKRPNDTPTYSQFLPLQFDNDNDYNITNTRCSAGSITPPPNLIGCDSIIMLQHDPVYTLGTASDPSFIKNQGQDNNPNNVNEYNNTATTEIPIMRIERGGEVTYHGPGQLTVYPILDLRGYKQDVHWYMRALEEVILLALEKAGIKGATREENLTGVWVSNKKIAALGIKARRWVTMHGLAINVDARSLQNFEGIVPCGLEGRKVTCVNEEIGHSVTSGFTVGNFSCHMKEALEEILCVTLIPVKQS
jgi:lipoyl(octanoyl) transferase